MIPVYNGEKYIALTIDSVLKHAAGFNVECIVVDDGSTDLTAEILKKYQGKIKVITQENSGESAAVNKGLNEASGEGIMVVSADDPILTSKIFEGMVDRLEHQKDVVAWYPDWNVIDHTGKTLRSNILPPYDFRDLFERNIVLPGPGTWFRRDVALSIGGRNPRWRYVGDYDFWLRLALKGNFEHRSEILAQWRSHSSSTSIAERGPRMAQERINVIEEFIENHMNELSDYSLSLSRANAYYLAARLGFFSRQVNSRKLFFSALKLNTRVLKLNRIFEIAFMITFPLSKIIVDKLRIA